MPVAADCKVCPHCGKVVAAAAAPRNGGTQTQRRTVRPRSTEGTYGASAPRPARQRQTKTQPYRADSYENRSYTNERRSQGYGGGYNDGYGYDDGYGYESERSAHAPAKTRPAKKKSGFKAFTGTAGKVLHIVGTAIKVAVLLAVIYGGIFVVQIYRVKLTEYPYATTMRLSHSNYGQAISGYFSSGHWSVNPFTGRCTYSGETYHHEDMELIFNARARVTLAEITVDGEPISESLTESKVMGMFI